MIVQPKTGAADFELAHSYHTLTDEQINWFKDGSASEHGAESRLAMSPI